MGLVTPLKLKFMPIWSSSTKPKLAVWTYSTWILSPTLTHGYKHTHTHRLIGLSNPILPMILLRKQSNIRENTKWVSK